MSQMQRKWQQLEARRIKNSTRDGKFRGASFVSGEELNKQDTQRRSLETLDKQSENDLKLQELKNKGGMEQVGYRQDAVTGRFGEQLGFDKSKFQQKSGETRRISDRDFRQATEQANRERYNKLLSGETDEFGDFLPGKEPMNPRDISEFMKNQDRFLSEQSEMSKTKGMPAAGQGRPVQDIYETVDKDGNRVFTNRPRDTQPQGMQAVQPPQAQPDYSYGSKQNSRSAYRNNKYIKPATDFNLEERLTPTKDIYNSFMKSFGKPAGEKLTSFVKKNRRASVFN